MSFTKNIFLVNLKDYPNIGIDLQISKLLFYIFVGLIVIAIVVNLRRATINLLIIKLLQEEILSKENAKTLTELDINNLGTRLLLSCNCCLSKIVLIADNDYTEKESNKKSQIFKRKKINFDEVRFYLNNESLGDAQKIVDVPTPSVINTLLFCILLFGIYICIVLIIPELLTFINNIIN